VSTERCPGGASPRDDDFIDLFFAEPSGDVPANMDTTLSLLENSNTNFSPGPEEIHQHLRPAEALSREVIEEISTQSGITLSQVLSERGAPVLRDTHIILENIRRSQKQTTSLTDCDKSLLNKNVLQAIHFAESDNSWGEAFILASMLGADETRKVTEKYIAHMSGKISPAFHDVLSFNYISIDAQGLSKNWVDYVDIAVHKTDSSDALFHMKKLITALLQNRMDDEARICVEVKSSLSGVYPMAEISQIEQSLEQESLEYSPKASSGHRTCIDDVPGQCNVGNNEQDAIQIESQENSVTQQKNVTTLENTAPSSLACVSSHDAHPCTGKQEPLETQNSPWWAFSSKSGEVKRIILPADEEKPYFNDTTQQWEVSMKNDDPMCSQAVQDGPPEILPTEIFDSVEFGSHGLNSRYADTFNLSR